MSDLLTLQQSAYRIRGYAPRMGEVQGEGYVGQALGWADVVAVGRLDRISPNWPARRFPRRRRSADAA
jgi:transketolase N-terminal domain/subunit